jgi:hypothetical protein
MIRKRILSKCEAMPDVDYALSLKQPWAALVIQGLKTIEVRRWPTVRRGRILIHASRVADDRADAWQHVPPQLEPLTRHRGGILGAVEIADCISYPNLEAFVRDQAKHLNEPDWYEPPLLYGFTLTQPTALAFRPYPGWFRFFPVHDERPATPRGSKKERG